jgi:hypothetical protein
MNFLCRFCGHVHEYFGEDYQPVDLLEVPQPKKPQHVVCIQLPCGKDGCSGLLRIRMLMDFDADPRAEAPGIMAHSFAHNMQCGKGHLLSGKCGSIGSFDAAYDELWEREG